MTISYERTLFFDELGDDGSPFGADGAATGESAECDLAPRARGGIGESRTSRLPGFALQH